MLSVWLQYSTRRSAVKSFMTQAYTQDERWVDSPSDNTTPAMCSGSMKREVLSTFGEQKFSQSMAQVNRAITGWCNSTLCHVVLTVQLLLDRIVTACVTDRMLSKGNNLWKMLIEHAIRDQQLWQAK